MSIICLRNAKSCSLLAVFFLASSQALTDVIPSVPGGIGCWDLKEGDKCHPDCSGTVECRSDSPKNGTCQMVDNCFSYRGNQRCRKDLACVANIISSTEVPNIDLKEVASGEAIDNHVTNKDSKMQAGCNANGKGILNNCWPFFSIVLGLGFLGIARRRRHG